MSVFEAIIFGIVQGLTEFLPISSTAHLVILQFIFGTNFEGLTFEILLHVASMLAVVLFFRKDILAIVTGSLRFMFEKKREDRGAFLFALYLIIATAITGALGLILEDAAEQFLKSPFVIAGALFLTGLFLLIIERIKFTHTRSVNEMNFIDAIVVGLAQTLAVIPGVSRSGSTLIASLALGIDKKTAIRFSFLLSIPVILGSSVLAIGDLFQGGMSDAGTVPLITAFVVTFIFSIIGIKWLIGWLEKSKLFYFAIYCFILAIFVAAFLEPAHI
ncbi:undecaprenyl-diphosphatase UppP [Geomicrobium sp. JCM 19039]|uniref:undecaprenyl-diphosphatase UppP n=1 Tax=Geomicrobium sp. JCM 19039 TaxID=1460636 RepID=UPI00045F23C6|nr:undecaprenyl-diphosphatase UppP [Geomicrobium sp. JCM 19039]GAK12847.1 undecaprenyl-diphosphatase [Geomicrobium sp. JCM 19039]